MYNVYIYSRNDNVVDSFILMTSQISPHFAARFYIYIHVILDREEEGVDGVNEHNDDAFIYE